ncbi:putative proteasome-type protease [Cribrihabitans marinus]|uniref:Putative proteasome-type protease n=1 Tax=Cribrihabitans marinus TaxID=1227549 RepID=A0A1H6U4A6_9RHOB|nr:peptidase [Cribrihabitans marinus]GGH21113.1 peptidase [Cribrihabitans marinus]SEI85344.1 putative proteasome-type protease [Cribrihabitans marinus]
MTYCVGMVLDKGLVFMSDTRTNAGLDNISTFRKMTVWEAPGERVITLMSAGNLATTQAVVSLLDERSKSPSERVPTVLASPSMFQVARTIAETMREVIEQHGDEGQRSDSPFGATLIVGGQIAGSPPRLFMIYPEGNFIEAGEDTPFFQIGEMKYGRPILVRAYDPAMAFEDAIKLLLVSFDSTLKANLTVGAPFDYHCYEADSLRIGPHGRIGMEDRYFQSVSKDWGDALKDALDSLPAFSFPKKGS